MSPYLEGRQASEPTTPAASAANRSSAPEAAAYHPVSALDFSNIGSDILQLEEEIRKMHVNHTLSALDRLQSESKHSGGAEVEAELDFGRLTHLMKQVREGNCMRKEYLVEDCIAVGCFLSWRFSFYDTDI